MNPIALGCILGHHSLLSIAELLSFLGNNTKVRTFDREFVLFEDNYDDLLHYPDSLGGIQKVCVILKAVSKEEVLPTLSQVLAYTVRKKHLQKLTFSVSAYGLDTAFQRDAIISLKRYASKLIPAKVRFINKDLAKNPPTAALLGQKVLEKGVELVVFNKGEEYYVGYTHWVQDINGYTRRDVGKPKRNMKVGMLPPKLAQTLINLVPGIRGVEVIWDPFVGLGTIPMEALLLGRNVVSTDVNGRMVDATEENIRWIRKIYRLPEEMLSELYVQDVTTLETLPGLLSIGRSAVVTEGYLGQNFTDTPDTEHALSQLQEVAQIYQSFFKNLKKLGYKEPVVITFPFHISARGEFTRYERLAECVAESGFRFVPLLQDEYQELITKDKKWKEYYTSEGTILYTRGKQFVGREILCVQCID